jgi:uncharacterized membrane protein YgdD (TMEM256/DUF423 family)
MLVKQGTLDIWEKAVLYQMFHTLGLLILAARPNVHTGAAVCFLVGMILFCGSLYGLALTNVRWLGAVTPLGGVGFLAGWVWLLLRP